jgi:hypothetical protein
MQLMLNPCSATDALMDGHAGCCVRAHFVVRFF